jgi:hypothetical protein
MSNSSNFVDKKKKEEHRSQQKKPRLSQSTKCLLSSFKQYCDYGGILWQDADISRFRVENTGEGIFKL